MIETPGVWVGLEVNTWDLGGCSFLGLRCKSPKCQQFMCWVRRPVHTERCPNFD